MAAVIVALTHVGDDQRLSGVGIAHQPGETVVSRPDNTDPSSSRLAMRLPMARATRIELRLLGPDLFGIGSCLKVSVFLSHVDGPTSIGCLDDGVEGHSGVVAADPVEPALAAE